MRLEGLIDGMGLEATVRMRLSRYGALVLAEGRSFNLTGAKTPEQAAEHLRDSLTILPYVRDPYVDLGSGAGFPAMVAALVTGIEVTMVEATAKKARFLESMLDEFQLRGRVIAERAENAARRPELRERFASATARALGSAPTVAELALPFLKVGGGGGLPRGIVPPEEQSALEDAALMLGAKIAAEVPLEGNRRIILV